MTLVKKKEKQLRKDDWRLFWKLRILFSLWKLHEDNEIYYPFCECKPFSEHEKKLKKSSSTIVSEKLLHATHVHELRDPNLRLNTVKRNSMVEQQIPTQETCFWSDFSCTDVSEFYISKGSADNYFFFQNQMSQCFVFYCKLNHLKRLMKLNNSFLSKRTCTER